MQNLLQKGEENPFSFCNIRAKTKKPSSTHLASLVNVEGGQHQTRATKLVHVAVAKFHGHPSPETCFASELGFPSASIIALNHVHALAPSGVDRCILA